KLLNLHGAFAGEFRDEIADRRLFLKEGVELLHHAIVGVTVYFRAGFIYKFARDHEGRILSRAQRMAPLAGGFVAAENATPISSCIRGFAPTEPETDV